MKKSTSRSVILVLLCATLLLCCGLGLVFDVFRDYEWAVFMHNSHRELMDTVHRYSYKLMVGIGLVTCGCCLGLILFLDMLRKTARIEKEAEVLKKKNDQIKGLNQQIQQLAHHQRLELMGTLTSSIAHEFNNLLTPIMGYSLMVLEKLPPEEEEIYDNLLEVYNASRDAKNLISRLNDLSRKQSDNSFHQISLDEAVSHAMTVAAPAKPDNIQIRKKLNCWGQQIRANEIQLSQLLLNLILNGFHAMEEGGVLTLETAFDEKWAYIYVRDTGCGIPAEHLSKIFEPFFTTKEFGKGTGLGLAIVAQTVEDHQGHIEVDSEVGVGTTFTVKLPR